MMSRWKVLREGTGKKSLGAGRIRGGARIRVVARGHYPRRLGSRPKDETSPLLVSFTRHVVFLKFEDIEMPLNARPSTVAGGGDRT